MATARKRNATAAEDEPELVDTNPTMANLINALIAIFCVATVGTYAYMVHKFFSLEVPRWEALAWSAAQAPMYRVPAFVVPMLRKDIISIYTTGTPAANKQMMKLPVSEDV